MTQARFFLGLDGGATHCRARLCGADGRALAEVAGPAANIYVDYTGSLAVIETLAERALAEAGLGLAERAATAFGLGLAGVTGEADGARIAGALPGWRKVEAVNDAVTACIGANGLGDGGLIIAGTGSAGIARVNGATTILGGRGIWLGDDGSGARIGAEALRGALRALDGLEPNCALYRELQAAFHDDPVELVRWAPGARPSDYGAFAPKVFAAAARGEPQALEIVAHAARAIAALARALIRLGAPTLALVGGVAGPLRPYLPADIAERLHTPRHDALDGAILMVGGALREGVLRG